MQAASYQPLDDALEFLSGYGSGLANGNFNHAPMVAEALCALGRPEAVMPWLEHYRERLLPLPAIDAPIRGADWRDALGRRGSYAAWRAFFADELRDAAWQEVLAVWIGRLAPGIAAAATHGAIRVGHAVRALGVGDTSARRGELAGALASWAASYRELPSAGAVGAGGLSPREAIARLPVMPPAQRGTGNITAALARLGELPEFAAVVSRADLAAAPDALLAELTELFALVYLANVGDRLGAIVFIHGVTSLTALGHVAPYLDPATVVLALRHAWQTACGLYACYGNGGGTAVDVAPPEADDAALIERVLANGDEHVIKFAEACLYRDSLAPSPVYRAAIGNALTMLPPR